MTEPDHNNPLDGFTPEDWKPVHGYQAFYQVSSLGAVQSLRTLKFLRPLLNKAGYPTVTLCGPNGQDRRPVHLIVLRAFLGPCPKGYEAGHLNGDESDCRLCNLLWVTHAENEYHKHLHGTSLIGAKNHQAKLTIEDVIEMRRLKAAGARCKDLAVRFGVAANYVSKVCNGHVWARALSEHWRKGEAA